MRKNLFITFEGVDGCGKTTQIELFTKHLESENKPYIVLREPGGTVIGEKIRSILLDKEHSDMQAMTELLLYSASRYQLTTRKILKELEAGKTVICDRFYDSTTAYQGFARGLDRDFIKILNKAATDNTAPDLTFLINVSFEERARRISDKELDRLELEHDDFHKKVIDGFLSIAEEETRFRVINGERPAQQIAADVWQEFIKKCDEKE